jgi:hypothetical protein
VVPLIGFLEILSGISRPDLPKIENIYSKNSLSFLSQKIQYRYTCIFSLNSWKNFQAPGKEACSPPQKNHLEKHLFFFISFLLFFMDPVSIWILENWLLPL